MPQASLHGMTRPHPGPNDVRLTVPALPGLELVAAETAASLAALAGADEATAGDIRMAVIEGCINAIEHAYAEKSASDCTPPEVHLRFQLVPSESDGGAKLSITIRDSGRGFDVTKYEEPNLEKKLHSKRKRGWGLKLIRGFMDDLQVISGREGTVLEMTKFLAAEKG